MNIEDYDMLLTQEYTDIVHSIRNETGCPVKESMHSQEVLINIDGHRGSNFKKNIDILYSGCSLTFGTGLPQEAIWGEMLSESLNLECNNISYQGGSIINIVNNIFNYINKYGDPKIIACCFPALDRIRWFDDGIITEAHSNVMQFRDHSDLTWVKGDKYIKLPSSAGSVLHGNAARYFSIFAIKSLENYCNDNGIYFRWTSWVNENVLDKLNFNNFIKLFNDRERTLLIEERWCIADKYDNEITCHLDLYESNKEIFYTATDNPEHSNLSHMGKHIHFHIAELFERQIRKDLFN